MDEITTTEAPESTAPELPLTPQTQGASLAGRAAVRPGQHPHPGRHHRAADPRLPGAGHARLRPKHGTQPAYRSAPGDRKTEPSLSRPASGRCYRNPRSRRQPRAVDQAGDRAAWRTDHITDGRVYVDGTPLDEPYLAQPTQGSGRSWIVPPLNVFVMGDNRGASRDSRIFGPVPLDQIVGHAVLRYWPPEQIGILN